MLRAGRGWRYLLLQVFRAQDFPPAVEGGAAAGGQPRGGEETAPPRWVSLGRVYRDTTLQRGQDSPATWQPGWRGSLVTHQS